LEPAYHPLPAAPTASRPTLQNGLDAKNWPDGSQMRKHRRYHEPDGWAHSNWSWRSNGHIDHQGSLHPKPNKAECRCCLGIIECEDCGKISRPSTKVADMKAQLDRRCQESRCGGSLLQVDCEARTYHYVIEEAGIQYSIWEHTGYHKSHSRPPVGRRPPRSVPMPPAGQRKSSRGEIGSSSVDSAAENMEWSQKILKPAKTGSLTSATKGLLAPGASKTKAGVRTPSLASVMKGPPAPGASKRVILSDGVVRPTKKKQIPMVCEGCGELSESCDLPGPGCTGTMIWREGKCVYISLFFISCHTSNGI
jgi:hypothetical protein